MPGFIALLIACGVAIYFVVRSKKEDNEYFAGSGRKPAPKALPNKPRDWPAIVAKAKQETAALTKPCVALDIGNGVVEPSAHSSIGGMPSLPPDASWPEDASGKPMIFLAQINFAEMPELDGYPDHGVLGFFVMDDDLNGCDFPSRNNAGFQVLFHPNEMNLERRSPPDVNWEFVPMSTKLAKEGRPLIGRSANCPPMPNSTEIGTMTADWYPDCPNNLWDEFSEGLIGAKPSPFYYGGHPDFTQQDYRRPDDDPKESEVILQLGFLSDRKTGIEVCWGDAGEACFLMTPEDLQEKHFDRAAYNWDCC